jgi:hypothetical protein
MNGIYVGRTFASRDNKVLPISLEAGEADVGNGTGVAVAGQGQILSSGAVGSHDVCEEGESAKVFLL